MSRYLDWHVGMKVVCVMGESCPDGGPEALFGEVYTLAGIWVDEDGDVMISLKEVPSEAYGNYEAGFFAHCFRPVQTRATDISVFTAILNGARSKEKA